MREEPRRCAFWRAFSWCSTVASLEVVEKAQSVASYKEDSSARDGLDRFQSCCVRDTVSSDVELLQFRFRQGLPIRKIEVVGVSRFVSHEISISAR